MPSETTPNLALPYIAPSQAQKHVTHNEAIRALDAVVQLAVLDHDLATPPASPADGDRYIVPAGASGDWSGHEAAVAAWQDGGWCFYAPREGWVAWVADEGLLHAFDGAAWVGASITVNPASLVGVNTTADVTNKLAVKSDAVLFHHDDVTPGNGDSVVKVDKAVSGGTASILFQTGASGRAEIGTAGDNNLHLKTSTNGSTWNDALTLVANPQAGRFQGVGVQLNSDSSTNGQPFIEYMTNALSRIRLARLNAETGGNSGSDWCMQAFTDAGSFLSRPVEFTRATGAFSVPLATFASTGMSFSGALRPATDNAYTCGSSTLRWSTVWAATGTINTSDERLKTDIEDCTLGLDFITSLRPVLYRWIEGGTDVEFENDWFDSNGNPVAPETEGAVAVPDHRRPVETARPGMRRHAGLVAQEVKAALDSAGVDCGIWVLNDKDDPDSTQSLRYEQLIAPLIQAVKQLAVRLDAIAPA